MNQPLRLGLIGIGGYGGQHLTVLNALQDNGLCKLVAVGDPFAERHCETVGALRELGIEIYDHADGVIERDDIDAVFIATPIHLHAPQAIAALNAGKHVYLEKPPCATLGEWNRIKAARDAAGKVCAIGFQMQNSPSMRILKQALLDGAIGKVEDVWASLRWHRDDTYYNRSPWAARWRVDGHPVYDGPATNALSHVVHGVLYLAGAQPETWAQISQVRGHLAKARPVESYDCCLLQAQTTNDITASVGFIHATSLHDGVVLRCKGSQGHAELSWNGKIVISPQGSPSRTLNFHYQVHVASALNFLQAMRGEVKPRTDLDDTLAYMQMVNGALQSSKGSHPLPPDMIGQVDVGKPNGHYVVRGLDDQMAAFSGDPTKLPSLLNIESAPWVPVSEIGDDLAV